MNCACRPVGSTEALCNLCKEEIQCSSVLCPKQGSINMSAESQEIPVGKQHRGQSAFQPDTNPHETLCGTLTGSRSASTAQRYMSDVLPESMY